MLPRTILPLLCAVAISTVYCNEHDPSKGKIASFDALLDTLTTGTDADKRDGCFALMGLAESEPNRKDIAAKGFANALIDMIKENGLLQEPALRALGMLAMDSLNQKAILDAGGIEALTGINNSNAKMALELLKMDASPPGGVELDIPGFKTTYEMVKAGTGPPLMKGDVVAVHATGKIAFSDKKSGTKFWSTKDKGQEPFQYKAGLGKVIVGWDQGCLGMKLGEVRKLTIPPAEGYGKAGFPDWKIPSGATLLFEIEVLEIEKNHEEL